MRTSHIAHDSITAGTSVTVAVEEEIAMAFLLPFTVAQPLPGRRFNIARNGQATPPSFCPLEKKDSAIHYDKPPSNFYSRDRCDTTSTHTAHPPQTQWSTFVPV